MRALLASFPVQAKINPGNFEIRYLTLLSPSSFFFPARFSSSPTTESLEQATWKCVRGKGRIAKYWKCRHSTWNSRVISERKIKMEQIFSDIWIQFCHSSRAQRNGGSMTDHCYKNFRFPESRK